jgi:hypothetical protein
MGDYQLFPTLEADAYAALRADIRQRGVLVPVELDEQGNVLDGHHRVQICAEEGITEYPRIVRSFASEAEKRSHIRALNLLRRHLTPEQRQTVIDDQIRDTPERSDRQIAADLGVSPTTVGRRRAAAEASGLVSSVDTRADRRGRQQPAHKPRNPQGSGRSPEAVPRPWGKARPAAAGILATTPAEETAAVQLSPEAPDELTTVAAVQREHQREERAAQRAEAERWNDAIALGDEDGSIARATLILRFSEGLAALHRKWFCLDVALLVQAHQREGDPHLEAGLAQTRAFLDRLDAELTAQRGLRVIGR